ncbi:MAG: hypothetical protein DRI86_08695 [Bacteroidetes bacterium]|nr:MAG: hypothetical protein DRI86_08695 [Bacteroidota bacterium]
MGLETKKTIESLEFQKDLIEAQSIEVYMWMWPGKALSYKETKILLQNEVVSKNIERIKRNNYRVKTRI